MVRCLTTLAASLLLALFLVPAAPAKQGVRATIIGHVDLDARPGQQIRIAWRLSDADGRRFGAGDLFVRLRNPVGDRHVTTFTDGHGRFSVRITVPEGGIGRIEFGLRGWRTAAGRTSRADVLFPLENDPVAHAHTQAVAATRAPPAEDDRPPLWPVPVVAVGVSGVIVAVAARIRRRSVR